MISESGMSDSLLDRLLVSMLDSLKFMARRSSSDILTSCDSSFKFCQLGSDLDEIEKSSVTNNCLHMSNYETCNAEHFLLESIISNCSHGSTPQETNCRSRGCGWLSTADSFR